MQSKAKAVSVTGILAALSLMLFMYPHFVVIPAFPMFKMDFADLPALLASTVISPFAGVCVVIIRNVIHLFLAETMGVGELSNFVISSCYVFTAGILLPVTTNKTKGLYGKTIGYMAAATVVQVAVAVAMNYFVVIRLYEILMGFDLDSVGGIKNYIIMGVIPFNAIKAVINSGIFVVVYNALVPKIRRYI